MSKATFQKAKYLEIFVKVQVVAWIKLENELVVDP